MPSPGPDHSFAEQSVHCTNAELTFSEHFVHCTNVDLLFLEHSVHCTNSSTNAKARAWRDRHEWSRTRMEPQIVTAKSVPFGAGIFSRSGEQAVGSGNRLAGDLSGSDIDPGSKGREPFTGPGDP